MTKKQIIITSVGLLVLSAVVFVSIPKHKKVAQETTSTSQQSASDQSQEATPATEPAPTPSPSPAPASPKPQPPSPPQATTTDTNEPVLKTYEWLRCDEPTPIYKYIYTDGSTQEHSRMDNGTCKLVATHQTRYERVQQPGMTWKWFCDITYQDSSTKTKYLGEDTEYGSPHDTPGGSYNCPSEEVMSLGL